MCSPEYPQVKSPHVVPHVRRGPKLLTLPERSVENVRLWIKSETSTTRIRAQEYEQDRIAVHLWSPRRLGPASRANGATFGCARPQTAASRARRASRELADLPQAGVVADVKPALSVASAERNQLIDELTCEE